MYREIFLLPMKRWFINVVRKASIYKRDITEQGLRSSHSEKMGERSPDYYSLTRAQSFVVT